MSIVAFKKKSVILYGANVSGKPPGGYWVVQGPYGLPTSINSYMYYVNSQYPNNSGFSSKGSYITGNIGTEMKFSKNGTPFRGIYPMGNGGCCGTYKKSEPVFNMPPVKAFCDGNTYKYVKPQTLSTYGMLARRFKWIHYGKYPNYWVKPIYGNTTQSETASQGLYIQNLSSANDCVTDTNDPAKYEGYIKRGGPTLCQTSTARFKYNDMAKNAPYTKQLYQPQTSSQHTLRIQRRCANPLPYQEPIPGPVNGCACQAPGLPLSSNASN
jgi:hypothetical protein